MAPLAIPEPWEADSAPEGADEREMEPRREAEPPPVPVDSSSRSAEELIATNITAFAATLGAGPDSVPGHTAATFIGTYPEEGVERAVGEAASGRWYEELAGRWCVRSSRRTRTGDGRIVVRRALFYPPRMPLARELPALSERPKIVLETCRLGSYLLEVQVEPAAADSMAARVEGELTRRFGETSTVPRPASLRTSDWERYSTWRSREATVASGNLGGHPRSRVVAAAWTSTAGLDVARRTRPWRGGPGPLEDREIVRVGGLDREAAVSLTALASDRREARDPARRAHADSAFLDRLQEWVADGRRRPTPARAATLLIADRALATARLASDFARPDSAAIRRRLYDLGATLEHECCEGLQYGYRGDLLLEAYDLARGTAVGDLAFIQLLRTGFDPSPNCPDRRAFRRIIEEGEAFLEASDARTIDAGILVETHLLVAEAYGDIVAIVAGLAPEGWNRREVEDPTVYDGSTAAVARRRAVEHYQAVLDSTPRTGAKEAIWWDAWRLAAGLSPPETRFVCATG